jgi:hypothetical protein
MDGWMSEEDPPISTKASSSFPLSIPFVVVVAPYGTALAKKKADDSMAQWEEKGMKEERNPFHCILPKRATRVYLNIKCANMRRLVSATSIGLLFLLLQIPFLHNHLQFNFPPIASALPPG